MEFADHSLKHCGNLWHSNRNNKNKVCNLNAPQLASESDINSDFRNCRNYRVLSYESILTTQESCQENLVSNFSKASHPIFLHWPNYWTTTKVQMHLLAVEGGRTLINYKTRTQG